MYCRRLFSLCIPLVLTLAVSGCAVGNVRTPGALPSSAFFTADPADLRVLQALAQEQDQRIKHCPNPIGCEEAYYTRGLLALFRNRADAIAAFQELRTIMPDGRHAASSTRWLYLLQESSVASIHKQSVLAQLRAEVLHGLLGRDEPAALNARGKQPERRLAELNR